MLINFSDEVLVLKKSPSAPIAIVFSNKLYPYLNLNVYTKWLPFSLAAKISSISTASGSQFLNLFSAVLPQL